MLSGLEEAAERPSLRQTYHTVTVLAAGGLLLFADHGTDGAGAAGGTERRRVYAQLCTGVCRASCRPAAVRPPPCPIRPRCWRRRSCWCSCAARALLPVLSVSLAMGCTGAVADGFCLESFSAALHKAVLWVLSLLATVFSGVLSVQQMVAAAGDTLGRRAMKFSISSFVPVVGGALSEAYTTVLGCAGLLRSTVGCFGVVATVLTVLPPLVACLAWSICLQLAGSAAALFRLVALEKLCRTVVGSVRVLIAVLAVFALLMIVSTSVIVFTGKAG